MKIIKSISAMLIAGLTIWLYSDTEADAKKVKILKNNQVITIEIVDKGVAIERIMSELTKK
jgi:PII-like signaling protein